MGKEKEMLKELLANTQAIMKHLKIEVVEKPSSKAEPKKEIKKVLKKISAKKSKK